MNLAADLWVPGVTFHFREKRRAKTARLPVPKGNAHHVVRIGGHYSVKPTKRVEAAERALREALPPAPVTLKGAVRLEVVFVFEPPASWPQWKRDAASRGLVVCTSHSRGDLEQLGKLLGDAMERRGYFGDDCQVTEALYCKRYGPEQGYRIRVYDLGPGVTSRADL